MTAMPYAAIPGVEKPVSRLFFGTAIPDMLAGKDVGRILDEIFALGVTAFDCARQYGLAEDSLGRWMESRGLRDKIVLLTKCAHHDEAGRKRVTPQDIREDFAISCEKLRTDYFDLYLLHRDDPAVEVGPIVEVLNELHRLGHIGAFGGSNWTHRRIAEANAYALAHGLVPFTVSSPNFGLAAQNGDPWGGGSVTLSGPENAEARAWYQDNQMPVLAYSSLGRGLFSGAFRSDEADKAPFYMDEVALRAYWTADNRERLRRAEALAARKGCTVPQLALAWLFCQPMNIFALCSPVTGEMMRQNIHGLHIGLSPEESAWLDLRGEAAQA